MTAKKSLRKCINAHCRGCCYDDKAAGTWLAQVTLCSVATCELYDVRPTTDSIADSVYQYYGESPPPASIQRLRKTPDGLFSEKAGETNGRGEGAS